MPREPSDRSHNKTCLKKKEIRNGKLLQRIKLMSCKWLILINIQYYMITLLLLCAIRENFKYNQNYLYIPQYRRGHRAQYPLV